MFDFGRFWKDLGRVLGGVWEPKILDFRVFFGVFLMSFFKRGSEGEKIRKKYGKTKLFRFLASGLRWSPSSWRKERIGVRTLQIKMLERMSRLASCDSTDQLEINLACRWHTFGGRRIETPRGGHRRPPTFWRSGHLVMELLFLQVFGRSWRSWFQI